MLCRQSSYISLDMFDVDGVLNVLKRRIADKSAENGSEYEVGELMGAFKTLYVIRNMRLNNQAEFFDVFDGGTVVDEETD